MEFIKTKSFSFRDIHVPFWRLVEHGKIYCVTAIAFAVHHGLLKRRSGNCWRLPRSSKFVKAKTQLANTYFYKNATQFDKDLAKKIRTGLLKEWIQPISFQHATKMVNLETLLLILKFSGVEKAIVAAFQLFVADTFRQLTEQKDTEEQQKNEKLLATIRKEKVFKRKHRTDVFNKALEVFVKKELSVLRVETIEHNLQPWQSIEQKTPRQREAIVLRPMLRFFDFLREKQHILTGENNIVRVLSAPLSKEIQLFADCLGESCKYVSMLPVTRGFAIGFHLIAIYFHEKKIANLSPVVSNAVVARKIYKTISSKANKSRISEKQVRWNMDLLKALGKVLDKIQDRVGIDTEKLVGKNDPAFRAFQKFRILNFVFHLCLYTGIRPMTLVELEVFTEDEYFRRKKRDVEVVAVQFWDCFMISMNQTKSSASAPTETKSLWTRDRHTGVKKDLFAIEKHFKDAFQAYKLLNNGINRCYDTLDGNKRTCRTLLFKNKPSNKFTANGKLIDHPPYEASQFRSNNLGCSLNSHGEGSAFSTFFTNTVSKILRGIGSTKGLRYLFGSRIQTIYLPELELGSASIAMVQRFQFDPTLRVGIYDIRRARDSLCFAAVDAAQAIADVSGKDWLLIYAKRYLQQHLKVADHRESTAERHYNLSGVKDQIVNVGTGVAQTFATSIDLNDIFSTARNPTDIEKTVSYTHRLLGLRQLQVWVIEGKVAKPFRQSWCEWIMNYGGCNENKNK
jgi:hypothetical protein